MASLCSKCKHLFRKVFADKEVSEEDTLIGKMCLITQWDVGTEEVYECNKFEALTECETLFESLKGMKI